MSSSLQWRFGLLRKMDVKLLSFTDAVLLQGADAKMEQGAEKQQGVTIWKAANEYYDEMTKAELVMIVVIISIIDLAENMSSLSSATI